MTLHKFHFINSLLILFLLTTSVVLGRQEDPRFHELMHQYHENGDFNGAVLVAKNGEVVYKQGFGWANVEWEIPNNTDTRFRLASITKQFTALLVLQEVAKGKIKLDALIRDYLPDYPPKNGDVITIHQLLSHTSGMPHYAGIPGFFPKLSRKLYTPQNYIKLFWELDRKFEPGSEMSYSSFGYYLLGVILEKVTGKSYADLLQERIFDPLGMTHSSLDDDLSIVKNRAAGYDRTIAGFRNTTFRDMSTAYATGGMLSSVEDLFRWDRALYDDSLLPQKYRDLMMTPNLKNYGYGFNITKRTIAEDMTTTVVSHSGGINGFNSLITRLVDDGHLIVLLRNAPGTSLRQMTSDIITILYNQPMEMPRASAAREVGRIIYAEGLKAGVHAYQRLKSSEEKTYQFAEEEFNQLGYEFIRLKKYPEAIKIFTLNMNAFPASANTYDSLAEAYMNSGDRENAIKYYRLAIEKSAQDSSMDETRRENFLKNARQFLKVLEGS